MADNFLKHSIKHYKRPIVSSHKVVYRVRYEDNSIKDDFLIMICDFDVLFKAECCLAKVRSNIDPYAVLLRIVTDLLKY